jgi:hypothetical protein
MLMEKRFLKMMKKKRKKNLVFQSLRVVLKLHSIKKIVQYQMFALFQYQAQVDLDKVQL